MFVSEQGNSLVFLKFSSFSPLVICNVLENLTQYYYIHYFDIVKGGFLKIGGRLSGVRYLYPLALAHSLDK